LNCRVLIIWQDLELPQELDHESAELAGGGGNMSLNAVGGDGDGDEESKSESKQKYFSGGCRELPQELDNENAKLVFHFLEEHCRQLVDMGNILVFHAQRCLEEKISLKAMTNPENIYIIVNYLQFLTNHTVDFVQLVEKMFCLNHKLWALELEI
jgi:hypothetical protein